MIINREELLNALVILKPGLATNAIIKSMQNISFTGTELITFNEQIAVLVPFETDFKASVNHTDLMSILTKLKSVNIEVQVNNEELQIISKSTKAGLLCSSTKEVDANLNLLLDQMPNESDEHQWVKLPDDFIDGMLLCIMAADTSLQLQSLACLYANGTELICTDNKRVSNYTLNGDLGTEFFIRTGLIKELEKFTVTHFCATKSWVFFIAESGIIFAVKKLYGESLKMYLPIFDDFKGKGKAVKIPKGLKEVVNAASVMAVDANTKDIDIVIKDGELICTTQNERGWITTKIPIESTEKNPIELQVSAVFLQQILDLPDLMMTVGEGKSLFTSKNFRHVLMHIMK